MAHCKDLPVLWLEASEFLKKEKGMNWVQEAPAYKNNQFWNEAGNKAALE